MIEDGDIETRLDKFIFKEVEVNDELSGYFSRTKIQELINDGFLRKNGEIFTTNAYKVKLGDEFLLKVESDCKLSLIPKEIPLNIVYEDDDLAIINKQAGLTTHPGAGNYDNTLVNGLLFYYKDKLSTLNGFLRPGIVHRLDKDTSGLMVIVKNDFIHNLLAKQIAEHEVKRVYNAVVWGKVFPESGRIEGYISRCKSNRLKMEMNPLYGKYSLTNYKVLENFGKVATLVECKLETGRTHQIRVHFSSNKYPLVGDQVYCPCIKEIVSENEEASEYINNFSRQALHSKSINFIHPRTNKEMFFEIDLPDDMQKLVDSLREINMN